MQFSRVPKCTKKKRKIGVPPAPAPAPIGHSHFQLHTPPSTPSVVPLHSSTKAPSQLQMSAQKAKVTIDDGFEEFVEGAFSISSALNNQLPAQSRAPDPLICPPILDMDLPWPGHNNVTYEIRDEPSTQDQTSIKERVDRYYPLIVGQHVPPTPFIIQCATQWCFQPQDTYFSCADCSHARWHCQECTIARHRECVWHQIDRWDVVHRCKISTSLGEIGLVLELDHTNGQPCNCTPSLSRPLETLTVMHTNGIHRVPYRSVLWKATV
jgi:hypothetical protein